MSPLDELDPIDDTAEDVTDASAADASAADASATETSATDAAFRAGTVALVGRPNAGKSTLMNQLLPEKLAIVSSKPQTTRNRLVGILSTDRGQIVFYDTPGVHKPQHHMNRQMIKAAQEATNDADLVALIVDAAEAHGKGDAYMLEWLATVEAPKVVLLNKVDKVRKDLLLPRIALYAETGAFEEIVPISALRADGTDVVLDLFYRHLPEQPPIYDQDLLTVHPERFLAAERIREKVLERTGDELPFATAVVIDQWEQKGENLIVIHASILAERAGQKKILIGSGGRTIKSIGAAAREDLEEYLDSRVFLDLNVKVERDWRESRRILSELDRAPFDVELG